MKINEVTEGVGDWLARKAGERVQQQQQAASANDADNQPVDEPDQSHSNSNIKISRLGPDWKDTTLGISIKPATQTSPAIAYYQKKYYVLTNFGKWLTANKRPVPNTMAAILNQALEQT